MGKKLSLPKRIRSSYSGCGKKKELCPEWQRKRIERECQWLVDLNFLIQQDEVLKCFLHLVSDLGIMITNEPTETNFIGITGIEAKMEQIDE